MTESSRCSKKCTFERLQLNSSIPWNFCPSSNDSNDDINQECQVKLAINFTTGFVNVMFDPRNQSSIPKKHLEIVTLFSLNDTSIEVNITYICSTSDYCDLEFVRETLSPKLAAIQMESLRQKLAARLYNVNNTAPVICSNSSLCQENTSFCSVVYSHHNGTNGGNEEITSECLNLIDDPLIFYWIQDYTTYATYAINSMNDLGIFFCNIPNCGSNGTIIETFQWLTREYILPINMSILNVTTTTSQPKISTSTKESTTTSNNASILFGHINIIILCFLIIFFLH